MIEEQIPREVFDRLTKIFDGPMPPTPHSVAQALRTLGRSVSDSVVLEVYEQLRAWQAQGGQMPDAPGPRIGRRYALLERWSEAGVTAQSGPWVLSVIAMNLLAHHEKTGMVVPMAQVVSLNQPLLDQEGSP